MKNLLYRRHQLLLQRFNLLLILCSLLDRLLFRLLKLRLERRLLSRQCRQRRCQHSHLSPQTPVLTLYQHFTIITYSRSKIILRGQSQKTFLE